MAGVVGAPETVREDVEREEELARGMYNDLVIVRVWAKCCGRTARLDANWEASRLSMPASMLERAGLERARRAWLDRDIFAG